MPDGLLPFPTHPAPNQTVLLLGTIWALGAAIAIAVTAAAAVVTEDHAVPGEAVPAADVAGATPGGDPGPAIHHGPGPPSIAAINHGPTGGANLIIEAGLNLLGGTQVIDPILQIANAPDVLRSLLTENVAEHRVSRVDTVP